MSTLLDLRRFANQLPDKTTAKALIQLINRTQPTRDNNAITAFATGGQTNATALKRDVAFHNVTTVATAADSIKLPPAVEGEVHFVKNSTSTTMQVFGSGTDTIDSVATGTGVPQLGNDAVMYFCTTNGNYLRFGGVAANEVFTAITTNSITGGANPLTVAGLDGAQGGAVTTTGGTSSTAGNAGGAVSMIGGTPGATGIGGAAAVTAGAGGATSGAGGTAIMSGGAATTSGAGGLARIIGGAGAAAGAGGAAQVFGGVGGATGAVGGAGTVTGGAGNGAANGGVASLTGGASGAGATGNGGAANIAGGLAVSTNGNGGAISLTGGAGVGSGNGGAVSVTTGAAGATGVAGALSIAVGAATAGAGSDATIAAGAGAGGTAAGGNLILTSGAAVSTGIPGEVKLNNDATVLTATYYFTGTPAATNQVFFVAPRACRVQTIKQVHSVAAGGVSTLTVIKDTGTTAPGAGTSLHQSGSFNLNATANTVQTATLSTTVATVTLAAGDRLSVNFANTIQSTAGLVVTVGMSAA